eukprot:10084-Heterococcus_DN1.PRE.4
MHMRGPSSSSSSTSTSSSRSCSCTWRRLAAVPVISGSSSTGYRNAAAATTAAAWHSGMQSEGIEGGSSAQEPHFDHHAWASLMDGAITVCSPKSAKNSELQCSRAWQLKTHAPLR